MRPNSNLFKQREAYIQDLETLFRASLEKENFASAVRAKEVLGRVYGFFAPPQEMTKKSSNTNETGALRGMDWARNPPQTPSKRPWMWTRF